MFCRSVRSAALIAAAVIGLAGCAEIVEPGHRGVHTETGKVTPQVLNEGLHWYAPWNNIIVMDTRLQRSDYKTLSYTRDLQEATLHFTVTFSMDPSAAPVMLQTIGDDWADKVVGQDVFDRIKAVVGSYTAADLIAKRDEASAKMKQAAAAPLKVNHVLLAGVALTDVKYSDEYDNAVEAKAVAEQEAQAEINRTAKIREIGEQRKIDAEADATAMRSRANAIRENQSLLEWERLQVQREAVKKWNGGVPLYQFGGDAGPVPLIQLPASSKSAGVER